MEEGRERINMVSIVGKNTSKHLKMIEFAPVTPNHAAYLFHCERVAVVIARSARRDECARDVIVRAPSSKVVVNNN